MSNKDNRSRKQNITLQKNKSSNNNFVKTNNAHNNKSNSSKNDRNIISNNHNSKSNRNINNRNIINGNISQNSIENCDQLYQFRESYDVVIIGAGPAGLMAAAAAKSENPGLNIIILEGNSVAGKKLSATGNGKCNFTNLVQNKDFYRSNNIEKASKILEQFDYKQTIEFFENIGIPMRERNGYCYPYSEQAKAFRDVFVRYVINLGVEIAYDSYVEEINTVLEKVNATKKKANDIPEIVSAIPEQVNTISEKANAIPEQVKVILEEPLSKKANKFLVVGNNFRICSSKVVVCCGGLSYKAFGCLGKGFDIAKKFNIDVINPAPALCGMITDYDSMKWLEGVRAQAEIRLIDARSEVIYSEAGEIVFNANGVSGIPVLNASRFAVNQLANNSKVYLEIDFARDFTEEYITNYVRKALSINSNAKEALNGLVPDKLLNVFQYNVEKDNNLNPDLKRTVGYVNYIKHFKIRITDVVEIDKAQVTQGGVALESLNEQLEALNVPGLYFAGENVDVDGKCGGYNLQWAFSSGYVAGKSV